MNINLLKHLPLAAVCLSSAAFAGMDIDTRVSQLEMQMKQVRTSTDSKRFGAKTAEAGPMIVDGYDVTIGLGAIYQSAALAGTDYAVAEQGIYEGVHTAFLPTDGSIKEPESAWAWGINAMLGFNFERDGWDLRLTNSYYDTNETNTIEAGYGGVLIPTRIVPELYYEYTDQGYSLTAAAEAQSRLGVAYDLLGIELGRDYFVSSHLAFRPNYGLLASWLWNDQKIDYSGDVATALQILEHNIYNVHDRSEWFGIGPQFGLGSTWGLGKGFSIFADTKGALMYGRFKTSHHESITASSTSETDPSDYYIDVTSNSRRIVPYIQSILGVSYSCFSDDNKNHFLFRLGYNVQVFFNANQFIYPSQEYLSDSPDQDYDIVPRFRNTFNNLQTSGLILDAAWSF